LSQKKKKREGRKEGRKKGRKEGEREQGGTWILPEDESR
jgi:hypothetical protein